MKNNRYLDTAIDTVAHLMVNIKRDGNISQDAMLLHGSCAVHTVNQFDSE